MVVLDGSPPSPGFLNPCRSVCHSPVLGINCHPRRLDMDWRWWRRARDKGVPFSINSDAHRPEQLQLLKFGVDVARKGWLRREDILSSRGPKVEGRKVQSPKCRAGCGF